MTTPDGHPQGATFRLAADLPSGQHARLWLNQDHHFAVIALPEPPLIVKPPLRWTADAIAAFTAALAEANRKEPDHG